MALIPGFESLEKLKKSYDWFDLKTKGFSDGKKSKNYGGIPLFYDAAEKKVYIDSGDTHTLVYGATGSLKTRSVVSPAIRILGCAGESMVINDPKGELFNRHAGDLEKQGYNIIEINLRDPGCGNAWNPLCVPYSFYVKGDYDNAAGFLHDIATNVAALDRSLDDPFWDDASADLLYGLILLTFKYAKDHDMPINAINIGNVLALRRILFSGTEQAKDTVLWKYASEDELISASLSGSVYAPKDTMNSILSVFDRKLRMFSIRPTLLDMLSNNDFDIADIGRKKSAVFIITPDEKTSYHSLVSMFVKESYEYLIYTASGLAENKVKNRINYILDEFSSLPQIADMPAMISAARSRDIRFLIVCQSKAALRQKYGENAETIFSNCTNWIFFTGRELELLRELSELCGMRKNNMPNISVYDLQHFSKEKREALLLCGRFKPAKVNTLDIDRFGDNEHTVKPHLKPVRFERIRLDFELKPEIREKYPMEISEKFFGPNGIFNKEIKPPILQEKATEKQPEKKPEKKTNFDPLEDFSFTGSDLNALIKAIDEGMAELGKEGK